MLPELDFFCFRIEPASSHCLQRVSFGMFLNLLISSLILICMVLGETCRGIFVAVVIRSEWQRGGQSLFGFVSIVCNNMWGNPEPTACFLFTL